MKLSKEKVLKIIQWREIGFTNKDIAKKLDVHEKSITYWIRRLRNAGYTVPTPNKSGDKIKL